MQSLTKYRAQLESTLLKTTKDFLENQENKSLFQRIATLIKNVVLWRHSDPDMERARNIQKIVAAASNRNPTYRLRISLLLIYGVYTSNSPLRNKIMNNIHNIFGDMDMKLRGGATRAFFLGRVGLEGRTINNTLSDLEEVFLHFHPNRQALDKLLVTPYSEKGPRTFVAIWHLHKNSIPARLPKDLVKKIVDLSHFDILAELERVAHSQVLVKVA